MDRHAHRQPDPECSSFHQSRLRMSHRPPRGIRHPRNDFTEYSRVLHERANMSIPRMIICDCICLHVESGCLHQFDDDILFVRQVGVVRGDFDSRDDPPYSLER